jgi:hypothetical protein
VLYFTAMPAAFNDHATGFVVRSHGAEPLAAIATPTG